MKPRIYIIILLLAVLVTNGFSQGQTRRELKDERKLEKQKQVEMRIYSKEFVFVPRTAIPAGMKPVNLSLNDDYIKFKPDFIDSYMPFFGRAYSTSGYGTDSGLKFTGKPEKFTIDKKAKIYEVNVVVKGENDVFNLYLRVGFEGSASLSVSSNNRGSISYQGEIMVPEILT